MNSMPSRIKTTYRDPLGRFVKIVFQAKGKRNVSLYNVYRSHRGSTSTSGIDTVWMQQWRCLKDKHNPCDPRKLCISELIANIQKDLEMQIHPILVGDFNEDLIHDSDKEGLQLLMRSCNVVQAYNALLGSVPSSRLNNRSVFHVFVYKPLLKYVLQLGVLPTEIGFHMSDHVPFYIDFHPDLFNYKESPIVPPAYRKLKMYDSPSVEKYVCYIKNQMHHHNILQRFLNLQDYIKHYSFDISAELELELLDDQMTQIRLRSEKRLCPEPSRFKNATKMQNQVHKIRHLVSIHKFWKSGLDYSHLVGDLKSYELEDTDLSSIITLQERISKERVDLKFLHEEEDVVRIDHLEYLYEKAIAVQNKQKATIIKNMKMRENQKRSWSKIRYVTKDNTNRNVERLGIPEGFEHKSTEDIWNYLNQPGVKPKFVYINDPDEIEKRLLEWQYFHYGQASETPLATQDWHAKLNPASKSDEEIEEIMKGKLFEKSSLPSESKDFLHHMTSNIQPEMEWSDIEITDKVFRQFYSGAKEATSSSPSGLHLGHWKAGAADKDICTVLAGIVRLSVQNTYTLKRWRKVVSVLMEKIYGHPTIHKFRTIHLLESDMNFILRYIWGRQFMRHNEHHQAWHSNQYGSRKGIQGQSASLNKVLTLDVIRYYAEPAAIVDNDAKACYDRMIPVLLSYALIRLGLPKQLTRFMCKWLEQAKYYIKTSKGTSKHYYSSEVGSYLYGTGQGTGWSPPNWGAVSDIISTAMSANAPGIKLVHPNRLFFSDRSFDAFVDDVNGGLTSDGLYTFHPSPTSKVPLLNTIYQQIQANVQYYSRLLFTSGGKLALDKCRAFILEFQWKNGTRHMLPTANIYKPLIVDQTCQDKPDQIQLLNPNEARKMLGAYIAPDGNTKLQFTKLHDISKQWGHRVSNGYLSRFDVQNSFKLGLIPALQYPLGVGVLTEAQCDKLLVPAMSTLLNKMGVVKTVNRTIVHGPGQYGGFNIPNLYTIQGYHKIQMMLGHMRKMDTTGDLIVIALATMQQELGITQQALSLQFDQYEFLVSPCWVKEVWRFLYSICGTMQIESQWTPKPSYARDINLMEMILRWDIPDSKKHIINLCRIYNKVYFVGDLYEANGTRIKPSVSAFHGNNYHDDKFPTMSLPLRFKEYWDYALTKITKEHPQPSKMGALLHAKSFKFRMSNDMQFVFEYLKGKRHNIYRMFPSLWKELSYVVTDMSLDRDMNETEYFDAFAVTVECVVEGTLLKVKQCKKIQPILESPIYRSPYKLNNLVHTTSISEIQEFDSILRQYDTSIVRNLGKIYSKEHIRQLALALNQGTLIGVGDASVDNDSIGHAYILESKPAKYRLCGVSPVDCVEEDQTSNRGESFTILALCTLVHALCKLYNIPKGSVTLYCDNKEALRRKQVSKCTFTTLSKRDVDVKMSVEYMVCNSPIDFTFEHVPGHVDDDPDFVYENASQQIQRNIDMHNLVTKFMKCPPRDLHPINITPFLPYQQIALQIHGQVIAGDIKHHIFMQRHGRHMETRLSTHRGIDHGLQHIIDWPALKLAFKNQDTLGKISSTKILHGLWPTMEKLEDRNMGVKSVCPRCKQFKETILHVFQCSARSSKSAFRESIIAFKTKLVKLKTAKPIISIFMELLVAFQENRVPVFPTFLFGDKKKHAMLHRVFKNQLLLGNNSFHVGYISYKWSMMQTLYLRSTTSYKQVFDVSWSAKVISALWDFSNRIWTKRCSIVHSKNPETSNSLNDEELRSSIRKYLGYPRDQLSPTEKSLHLNISSNIIRASSITLARWLHLLAEERALTIRLKRTQQIRQGGTRPITGYFRRVASSMMGN